MISAPSLGDTPVDALAHDLEKLCIRSPEKERPGESSLTRRRLTRYSINTDSNFEPLEAIRETPESDGSVHGDDDDHRDPSDPFRSFHHQVLKATGHQHSHLANDPHIRSSISKHYAGQFDYLLSLPDSGADPRQPGGRIFQYGCNLLIEKKHLGRGVYCEGRLTNVYTLLATEIGSAASPKPLISTPNHKMAIAEPIVRIIPPSADDGSVDEALNISVPDASPPTASDVTDEGACRRDGRAYSSSTEATNQPNSSRSPSRSPSVSPSQARIEDSVEALDRLEEDLEALDAATRFERYAVPEKQRKAWMSSADAAASSAKNTLKKFTSSVKAATVRAKPNTTRPALRKSNSMILTKGEEKDAPSGPARRDDQPSQSQIQTTSRRGVVARPASLQPPKEAAKSTKAPTRPTFELPGEAVARRLKEQREARRSLHIAPDQAPPVVPQRTKSTKAPTRPNFELPGEAISRRKREQRERELKEQEEAERKRREFRAQPIRVSAAPATYPRETAASRARRAKVASEENASPVQPASSPARNTTPANASKRLSLVGASGPRPTLAKAASTSSLNRTSSVARGRVTISKEAEDCIQRTPTSRETSSSTGTGSVGGKRMTVTAEDVQKQRLRGKEIFEQDNSYAGERERERRERESAAKRAREEAAERSRQASREWAEKQRRRQSLAAQAPSST